MPVARRKWDITPTEMLELVKQGVDAVVAELRVRADEALAPQLQKLDGLNEQIASMLDEAASAAFERQIGRLDGALLAVRDDLAAQLTEHQGEILRSVEARLATLSLGAGPAAPGAQAGTDASLPLVSAEELAEAVVNALAARESGDSEALSQVTEMLRRNIEQQEQTRHARSTTVDRLDELLVDLRAGIAEHITRQHGVLLDVFEERLSEVRLDELAGRLPTQIGAVISEGIERSHERQSAAIGNLGGELKGTLGGLRDEVTDGLTELGGQVTGGLTNLGGQVTRQLEDLDGKLVRNLGDLGGELSGTLTSTRQSIDAAQREQTKTIGLFATNVRDGLESLGGELRDALAKGVDWEQQSEHLGELLQSLHKQQMQRLDELITRQEESLARQEATAKANAATQRQELDATLSRLSEELRAAATNETAAVGASIEVLRGQVDNVLSEIRSTMAAGLNRQDAALARVRQAEQQILDLAELVPQRVEAVLTSADGVSPHDRIEKSVADLVWALGEMRASTEGLHEEMQRLAADLPEAAATLRDAATRSEGRLADLVLRLSNTPAALPRLRAAGSP